MFIVVSLGQFKEMLSLSISLKGPEVHWNMSYLLISR